MGGFVFYIMNWVLVDIIFAVKIALSLRGHPMRGKIATDLGCLRVVENQPVSLDGVTDAKPVRLHGLDQPKTTLAMAVEKLTCLLTSLPKLPAKGMGSPSTPLALRVKSRGTYLLGAYVLAVESSYLLKVSASENL